MSKKIVASAVNCFLCNNVVASLSQCLDCIINCRSPGSHRKSCNSTFKSRNSLFKNILSGISKTAINITRIRKPKTVCSVL